MLTNNSVINFLNFMLNGGDFVFLKLEIMNFTVVARSW